MEVKIGVQHTSRELVIDTEDDVESALASALKDDTGLVTLTDSKGRKVIVPTDKIAYVELGSPVVGQVGFRS